MSPVGADVLSTLGMKDRKIGRDTSISGQIERQWHCAATGYPCVDDSERTETTVDIYVLDPVSLLSSDGIYTSEGI